MRANYYIIFLGLFFFLFSAPTYAQKPVLTDEDAVTETVTKEIDAVFKSEGFLKKKDKKFKDVTCNYGYRYWSSTKWQSFNFLQSG